MFRYETGNAVNSNISDAYRFELYSFFSDKGTTLCCKKNTLIEISGEMQNYVYLVKQGTVKQDFIVENGGVLTSMLLSRGDLFGEVTYLHGDLNPINSIAHSDVVLERITSAQFAGLLQQRPEIYKYLSYMLAYKVRILLALVHDTSFCRVDQRLVHLLQRLASQFGHQTVDGLWISEVFTHQDLAHLISTTRSTVTRLLRKLVASGSIEIKKKHIILRKF